MKIKLFY